MSELMKNMAMLVWVACAINSGSNTANAQGIQEENISTTIIEGVAAQADGKSKEVIVRQPSNEGNPLGNPLADVVMPSAKKNINQTTKDASKITAVKEVAKKVEDDNTQNLGKDFQNTLLEANGMVYDVQAYPTQDLKAIGNTSNPKTIYSPNVNP